MQTSLWILLVLVARIIANIDLEPMYLDLDSQMEQLHLSPMTHTNVTDSGPDPSNVFTLATLVHHPQACAYDLRNAYQISASFWSLAVTQDFLRAYKCDKITDTLFRSAVPDQPLKWGRSTNATRLAAKACRFMAQHKASPQGQPLVALNGTHFRSNNFLAINHTDLYATTNWSISITNYHLQIISIQAEPYSNIVSSPEFLQMHPCKFQAAYCQSDASMVVWNVPSKTEGCEVAHHLANFCYLTPTEMLCPDAHLAIMTPGDPRAQSCGINLGLARAIVQDPMRHVNDLRFNVSHKTDFDIHHIYDRVRLGHRQHVFVYHIATCSHIPRFRLKDIPISHRPIFNHHAEWTNDTSAQSSVSHSKFNQESAEPDFYDLAPGFGDSPHDKVQLANYDSENINDALLSSAIEWITPRQFHQELLQNQTSLQHGFSKLALNLVSD